jgi:23S rRNA pseudouridine1911/1915/1917 synthase
MSPAKTAGPTRAAHLVYLADRFAAIDKPAGLSLRTPKSAPHEAARRLVDALPAADRAALAGREPRLVHRLDESTSGLVLVALDEEMHRELLRRYAEKETDKRYLAIVWGHPRPGEGSFESPLGPDRRDRRKMKVDPGGSAARSDYRVRARAPHVALVELRPRTGRTHQLRVHLAGAGHPVVGDDLYGGPRERAVRNPKLREALAPGRSLLHAWTLELPGLEPSRFTAPPPADFRAAAAAAGLPLDFS